MFLKSRSARKQLFPFCFCAAPFSSDSAEFKTIKNCAFLLDIAHLPANRAPNENIKIIKRKKCCEREEDGNGFICFI